MFQEQLQSSLTTSNSPVHEHGLTAAPRILAIEDDSALQKVLKRLFEAEGYTVDLAKDGLSGLERFRNRRPSAIVLDLRLPDISGQEVCEQITRVAPSLPVIVLSAKAEVADKVVLLEMGACDYVTMPFSPRDLLARVRVALRRVDLRSAQVGEGNVVRFDDVTMNISNAEVTRGGCSVLLTGMEFKILEFMTRNAQRVISREELLKKVFACPQQPYRVQILNPLAVGYVALASGHTLQIVRIDQMNFEPALLQYLKQWDPVHPCRLHRHSLNPAPAEPIGKCMQVAGEAAEPARRLLITIRWYRDENLLRANIDASRIRLQYHRSALSLLCSLRHGLLLVAGERGPKRESLQSPDRDRCTAPQTSSLTYPQPQTHACGRAHQAPMPTSGRSLPRSPALISSLTSSSFRSYLSEAQSFAYGLPGSPWLDFWIPATRSPRKVHT